jgi:REP element-mobilizing transposase RayT
MTTPSLTPNPDPLGPIKALTGPYMGMTESVRRRRMRRVKFLPGKASTCFHVMSRLCEGVAYFDDTEKEALVLVLRRLARFCGLNLLTYCVMGNHFHALVRVPDRQEWLKQFDGDLGESRLLTHLRTLYSKAFVELLVAQLDLWRQDGREDLATACLTGIKTRFCDLSIFGKEVKARFARWYNKRHSRRGVLWMGRFKSVLVEGRNSTSKNSALDALQVMAAYIDLNPVRAGVVETADAYRWSGWGAASAEDKAAIEGLCEVIACEPKHWAQRRRTYANWVSEDRTDTSLSKNNSTHGLLDTIRAFTQGVAIGSESFVEGVFNQYRESFGEKRKSGARQVRGKVGEWRKSVRTLRELRPSQR